MPFNFVSSEACSTVDMSSKNNLLVSKNKKKVTNSELADLNALLTAQKNMIRFLDI